MANDYKICIVGLGPAGLGVGLRLSQSPISDGVVCFEAGGRVEERVCAVQNAENCKREDKCQVIMGVGGASVLSGCKLSTFPAGRGIAPYVGGEVALRKRLDSALRLMSLYMPITPPKTAERNLAETAAEFARLGFEFRHYSSYLVQHDDLAPAYNKMVAEMSTARVTMYLNTLVGSIESTGSGFRVTAESDGNLINITCDRIIIAAGRSGMRLLSTLDSSLGLGAMANRCDLGVRLEFPVSVWPDIDRYHNDLKLHFESPEIGHAQTFCVSKNGMLAPYRLGDFLVIAGHISAGISTGFTNLSVMVRQDPHTIESHTQILADVRARLLAQTGGIPIRQNLYDFLLREGSSDISPFDHIKSSISYWSNGNVEQCFPPEVAERIWHAVSYFVQRLVPNHLHSKVFVFAPALEYYWPKFPLALGFVSNNSRIHFVGDCTGHFRGILQAFCSGLACAEWIVDGHVQ